MCLELFNTIPTNSSTEYKVSLTIDRKLKKTIHPAELCVTILATVLTPLMILLNLLVMLEENSACEEGKWKVEVYLANHCQTALTYLSPHPSWGRKKETKFCTFVQWDYQTFGPRAAVSTYMHSWGIWRPEKVHISWSKIGVHIHFGPLLYWVQDLQRVCHCSSRKPQLLFSAWIP